MTGDNTKWQQLKRARNRVFESVLEGDSVWMIQQAYQDLLKILGETDKSHVTLEELMHDAHNYIIAVQGGHTVIVSKKSPYAQKLIAEGEEWYEKNEDRKLMRKMRDGRSNHGV